MIFKGVVIGVLNIDSLQPNTFTARDAEAAQAFADQAAVALENARLYEESVTRVEQELEIARRIQSNLFPRTLPQLPGLTLDARCLPARETGGDFFDFVRLNDGEAASSPERLAIIVGDASGKSITGAMLMAIARSIVRSEARNHQLPETVMRETNRWIAEDVPRRSFVALSYATLDLDTRRLALANGGQLAPLRRRPSGDIEYLEVPGPTLPLGILPNTPYAAHEVVLDPGDLLVFYTDGIVEARNAALQLFGFERLEALVRDHGDRPPSALIDLVLQEITAFMGDVPQHDDMTIVALLIVLRRSSSHDRLLVGSLAFGNYVASFSPCGRKTGTDTDHRPRCREALEEAELLDVVARRQCMEAVRGCPLGARAAPVVARHDHVRLRVEGHALSLEQIALLQSTCADRACFCDDPLPGHVGALRRNIAHRVANGARVAAATNDRGDIAIGCHHAAWHLRCGLKDPHIQRIVGRVAHRSLHQRGYHKVAIL